jgi:hypothetical protein
MSQKQKDWLDYYQRNEVLFKAKSGVKYIPIKAHIAHQVDSATIITIQDVLLSICDLNTAYDSANIQFYLIPTIDRIYNTTFYNTPTLNSWNTASIMGMHNVNNALNIYYVNYPGACGYYNSVNDAVVITKACILGHSLAHNVGHLFSLPHTFQGQSFADCSGNTVAPSNFEKMDGSNCYAVADKFCDTPPDYYDNSFCANYCHYRDADSVLITPDSTLVMSLSNCATRFSNEQIAAMNADLNSAGLHPQLNSLFTFNKVILSSTKPLSPDTLVYVTGNYIIFKWRKVANAEHYVINVDYGFDLITPTADTFFIYQGSDLNVGVAYRWRVKPIATGNLCENFSSTQAIFIASAYTGFESIINNKVEIRLFPNPVIKNKIATLLINSTVNNENIEIEIYNNLGERKAIEKRNLQQGENYWNFTFKDYPSGVYVMKVVGDNFNSQIKFIID